MNLEQQARLVQIVVEPGLGQDKYRVCTGYANTKSRILTCAHALDGATRIQVRFVARAPGNWLEADRVWDGVANAAGLADAVDVAVLEVDRACVATLLGKEIEPVLAHMRPRDGQVWACRGMPIAAASIDKTIWELIPFGGKLYAPDAKGCLTLDVDCAPGDPNGWQGASGSPVMVAEQLVGVLSSWHASWAGRKLKATWLGHLWSLPEFMQAAGLDQFEPRHFKLRQTIATTLDLPENAPLRDALATRVTATNPDGAAIVDRLFEFDSVKLLRWANLLYDEFLSVELASEARKARELAKVLDEKLTTPLLPWLACEATVEQLRRIDHDRSMGYLNLPCGSMTLAELHSARLDGRAAAWATALDGGKFVVGELRLKFSVPHIGFGEKKDEALRSFVQDIGGGHNIDTDQMSKLTLAELAEQVNGAVGVKARSIDPSKPSRTPYIVFSKPEDESAASRLGALLTEMRVCRIDPNKPAEDESKICSLMLDFVNLRSRRESLESTGKFPA